MIKSTPKSIKIYFKVNSDCIYEKEATFDFFSGFAITQKQKSITSFHDKIKLLEGDDVHILEVSRKSDNNLGISLSAFNLRYNKYTVESVYQSSKVFNNKIQLKHLLYAEPLEAKREANEYQKNNELYITHFNFLGENISIVPGSLFYDYLYIKAIMQDPHLSARLLNYDCFTDIEFNHKIQFSSQARSCAIFVYLSRNMLIESYTKSVDDFRKVYEKIVRNDYSLLSM